MVLVAQLDRRGRPLPLGDIALQAPHAALDVAQPVVPPAALEEPPQRMRIEDADIAAPARYLDRPMPHGRVEQVADGVH